MTWNGAILHDGCEGEEDGQFTLSFKHGNLRKAMQWLCVTVYSYTLRQLCLNCQTLW